MKALSHYYCPQCGYDLSGQMVDRCPECNYHYDVPALQTLLNNAFNEACGPYIWGAKFLAAAAVLAVATLLRSHVVLCLVLALVFMLSPSLIQWWIAAGWRFNTPSLEPIHLDFLRACAWIYGLFLTVVLVHFQWVVWLVVGGLCVGVLWSLLSLCRHGDMIRNNQVLSLEPRHRALLERARATAWWLVVIDTALLAILTLRL